MAGSNRGEENRLICNRCAHRCALGPGRRGICGVRENRGGLIECMVYGLLIAAQKDPIEKKPLYHVLPGTDSYSVAAVGCNFRCGFCQNHHISQPSGREYPEGLRATPEEIVSSALREGAKSISYTYTEPSVFFEYARDTAIRAKEKGLLNIFVTNGYMTGETLDELEGLLDAANVDLKSFRDEFYRRLCQASLEPVLASLKKMKELGIWVEVTTLIIPGENDGAAELKDIASFIASLGRETPWHISRFFPRFKMTQTPPTTVFTLETAREIGLAAGLKYVYLGNLTGGAGEVTCCSHCGGKLIERRGYRLVGFHLQEGRCPSCLVPLEGLFSPG